MTVSLTVAHTEEQQVSAKSENKRSADGIPMGTMAKHLFSAHLTGDENNLVVVDRSADGRNDGSYNSPIYLFVRPAMNNNKTREIIDDKSIINTGITAKSEYSENSLVTKYLISDQKGDDDTILFKSPAGLLEYQGFETVIQQLQGSTIAGAQLTGTSFTRESGTKDTLLFEFSNSDSTTVTLDIDPLRSISELSEIQLTLQSLNDSSIEISSITLQDEANTMLFETEGPNQRVISQTRITIPLDESVILDQGDPKKLQFTIHGSQSDSGELKTGDSSTSRVSISSAALIFKPKQSADADKPI